MKSKRWLYFIVCLSIIIGLIIYISNFQSETLMKISGNIVYKTNYIGNPIEFKEINILDKTIKKYVDSDLCQVVTSKTNNHIIYYLLSSNGSYDIYQYNTSNNKKDFLCSYNYINYFDVNNEYIYLLNKANIIQYNIETQEESILFNNISYFRLENNTLLIVDYTGNVYLYDVKKMSKSKLNIDSTYIKSAGIQLSPNGKLYTYITYDKNKYILNIKSVDNSYNNVISNIDIFAYGKVIFSPDSSKIAYVALSKNTFNLFNPFNDKKIVIYDLLNNKRQVILDKQNAIELIQWY